MKDICLNIASFKEHRRIPVIQKGLDSGVSGFLLTGTSSTASRIALEYAKSIPLAVVQRLVFILITV